jgi:hypothetical protein
VDSRKLAIVLALSLLIALVPVLAVGCTSDEPAEETAEETAETTESEEPTEPPEPTPPPPLEPATYELVFDATWSAATHPTDFPGNPHFSGLIGATHGDSASVWQDGELASPGIKNMAETGGKSPLDAEIQALIDAGGACELISGGGVGTSPGSVSVTFGVNEECPLVSVVSMIAPSPDWFVGVDSLDLRDEEGGWSREVIVELYPWDAGTDSGASYASANAATNPPEPIFLMPAAPPIEVDGEVPAFGTFTFTLVEQ